jgi:hypothetical protein
MQVGFKEITVLNGIGFSYVNETLKQKVIGRSDLKKTNIP